MRLVSLLSSTILHFPFTSSDECVGCHKGSFAIENNGTFWASGKRVRGYSVSGFSGGDVVGFGLLILPSQRCLILTKNGQILGERKPILLEPEDGKADLFPIVTDRHYGGYGHQMEVEFNFGADLAAKPFKFELAQLNIVDV